MTVMVRRRFWLESATAVASGALAVLTLLWHDWIELATGIDPDHHSGSLEWGIVVVACIVAVMLATAARFEWRRRPDALPVAAVRR